MVRKTGKGVGGSLTRQSKKRAKNASKLRKKNAMGQGRKLKENQVPVLVVQGEKKIFEKPEGKTKRAAWRK